MNGNDASFGGSDLAVWRYLVPGPGRRVATTGPIHPDHRLALLDTFEEVVDARADGKADGLVVVPGFESPELVQAHLTTGGWAIGFGRSAFPSDLAPREHVALPSLGNARLIVSRSNVEAGLALYTPSRPSVRFALGMMKGPLATSLGWFGGHVAIVGGESDPLLIPPPDMMAVSAGTESAYRKATVLHMRSDGRPWGYAKLSSRPLASDVLAVEAARLTHLSGVSLRGFQVPRVQQSVKWGLEEGVFQSAPEKTLGPWKEGLSSSLIAALSELFQCTRVEKTLEESAFWREMNGWYEAVQARLPTDWTRRVEETLSRTRSHFGTTPLALGLAHGDFIDWNLKGAGDELFLFDWEQSVDEAPPFVDLLHWIVFTHHHVRRNDTPVLPLLEGDGPFGRARANLEAQLGLRCSRAHVALYAVRTALYHLRAWRDGYESLRERHSNALHTLGMVLDDALASDWSATPR